MEPFEVLLNGTLRLIRGAEGMVYPVVDGRLVVSKGVSFRPGAGGRCVELDIEVDEAAFRSKLRDLAESSAMFRVEEPEEG